MNKINYQKELDAIIEHLDHRPTILLQSCCGPCSSYVTEYLTKYFDITILFYNPNIFPESEYNLRLSTQKQLLDATGWASITDCEYNHNDFLSAIGGFENEPEGGARCTRCFLLRLERTAKIAKEKGFEYFGTTLTVSPHKNAELLNNIGKKLEEKYGIKYLISDFKKKEGYKRSIVLSRQYNLYRQEYCGCEYSIPKEENNT